MGVLWGSGQIGPEIGLSPRQANHLLSKGAIPGAVKIGGKWCIPRTVLRAAFAGASQNVA